MSMNDPLLNALSAELGALLVARGWRVTAAESCTGGLVAGAITATAGSSAWFDQAFVTYSNAAKTRALDVPDTLLAAHGAVSEPVARAMASGSLARAGADLSVAVTGIAGPGGGSPDKPVGTVCFAWALRESLVASATQRFDGDRAAIRRASVVVALEGLIERARGMAPPR
jgi:nicotinamide-nucleotide amidase